MTVTGSAMSHWLESDDEPELAPPAELGPGADVVVVGGGIMGVSIAYWLVKAGGDVVLAEVDRLASMASGRNAGLMLPGLGALEDPTRVREVLDEESIDALWETPGHLALASSPDVWRKVQEEAARRAGSSRTVAALDRLACEELLGMRIHERYLGGRWLPDGGLVHPLRLIRGLATAARRRGAVIAPQTAVFQVSAEQPGRGYDVHTSRGHIRAGQVVWACGAAFRFFRPEFAPSTTLARGQMLSTSPLPPLFRSGMAVDWGTVYWRQTADGAILLGGCRSVDLEGETGPGQRVNPRVQKALSDFLPEAFPGFPPFRVASRWAAVMDYTSDGRPLIGPVPAAPGQWVIAGFGGHGLPPALGAGESLADAILSGRMPDRLRPYDPARLFNGESSC